MPTSSCVTGVYSQGLTPAQALAVSRQLIDDSQAGGYSAIATQFHVDAYVFGEVRPWVDGTLGYAGEPAGADVDRGAMAAVRRSPRRHDASTI